MAELKVWQRRYPSIDHAWWDSTSPAGHAHQLYSDFPSAPVIARPFTLIRTRATFRINVRATPTGTPSVPADWYAGVMLSLVCWVDGEGSSALGPAADGQEDPRVVLWSDLEPIVQPTPPPAFGVVPFQQVTWQTPRSGVESFGQRKDVPMSPPNVFKVGVYYAPTQSAPGFLFHDVYPDVALSAYGQVSTLWGVTPV